MSNISRRVNQLREQGYVVSVGSRGVRIGIRTPNDTVKWLSGVKRQEVLRDATEKSDTGVRLK